MFALEIVSALERAKVKYAVVGGYALAFHGIVRATMDVDIIIGLNVKDFETAEKTLNGIGLKSRLPLRASDIIKMRKEYIANRNLIAWSFVDYADPSRQLDILFTLDVSKIETEKISVGGRKINVATLKQLLKMKLQAGRPQDLIDVENIREKLDAKK